MKKQMVTVFVGLLFLMIACEETGAAIMRADALLSAPKPLPTIDARQKNMPPGRASQYFVSKMQKNAAEKLKIQYPDLKISWNPMTGTPRNLYRFDGFLSKSTDRSAEDVVLIFVQANRELFRLTDSDFKTLFTVRQSVSDGSPLSRKAIKNKIVHLVINQRWQGRQVLMAALIVNVTGKGELVNVTGEVIPGLSETINAETPNLSSLQALKVAAKSVGAPFKEDQHKLIKEPRGPESRQTFSRGKDFNADVPVRLIYYPVSRNTVRLVWELYVGKVGQPYNYHVLVDAITGKILLRQNITVFDTPRWLVYEPPLDSPAPLTPGPLTPDGTQGTEVPQVLVQSNGDPVASPNGWLNGDFGSISGNNVIVAVDLDGDGEYLDLVAPVIEDVGGVATRTFRFPSDLSTSIATEANKKAAATNAFFVANWYHDRLFLLGFNEAAGNFQQNNFSGEGEAEDPVVIMVQLTTDSFPAISSDSPFFLILPDGNMGFLNASFFTGPDPDRDAGFDQHVLVHELTHGLTNRIVGGPDVPGLGGTTQARGLGEGYSDWYALSLLSSAGEDPTAVYAVAGWSTYHLLKKAAGLDPDDPFLFEFEDNYYYGLRRYPYTTDRTKSPLTLADIDPLQFNADGIEQSSFWTELNAYAVSKGEPEMEVDSVHNVGEIWALALWEVRAKLIAKYDWEIGNELALQLVTDSLFSLHHEGPTFKEARDAVILADLARTEAANKCQIWAGFAKRGLGINATTPASGETGGVVEDFQMPEECRPSAFDPWTWCKKYPFICRKPIIPCEKYPFLCKPYLVIPGQNGPIFEFRHEMDKIVIPLDEICLYVVDCPGCHDVGLCPGYDIGFIEMPEAFGIEVFNSMGRSIFKDTTAKLNKRLSFRTRKEETYFLVISPGKGTKIKRKYEIPMKVSAFPK
jgi:hypothetical protein